MNAPSCAADVARRAVDDFVPPWSSFEEFFQSREDGSSVFLVRPQSDTANRREWTVAEWSTWTGAIAGMLRGQGVGVGHVVATLLGNTPEALAVAYACWRAGACLLPLNPADSEVRSRAVLDDSQAVLLIHHERWAAQASVLVRGVGTQAVDAAIVTLANRGSEPLSASTTADLETPAVRIYTSGTTGVPKGVVLTAANLLTDCDALDLALDWPGDTRVVTVLPVHHVNGLIISSLLPWHLGISTVLCEQFDASDFWDVAQRENATVCSMVPTLLELLLAKTTHVRRPSPIREVLCGAGPLLMETVLEFEHTFGIAVRHLYGLSETTCVATLMPRMAQDERRRWYEGHGFPSIGQALPHAEVAVVDALGLPLGAGERGELAVRGNIVMRGYANREDANREAFADGWFHSADEGFWHPDPSGVPFFFITGRLKELIIRGGANISPIEVDEVLNSYPGIRHAISFPFLHKVFGEEVGAYLVVDGGFDALGLAQHCARELDHARRPKVFVIGTEVPYTATGKVKRLEIKSSLAPSLKRLRDAKFARGAEPIVIHLEK